MTKPLARFISIGFALLATAFSVSSEEGRVIHQGISVLAPFDMPAIQMPVFPNRDFVPTYEERLTPVRGIYISNVTIQETGTPFTILGAAQQPVEAVFLDNITINKAHGRANRYENVESVQETNVRILEWAEDEGAGP